MTAEQINKLTDELMVEIDVLPTDALIELYKKIEAKLKDVEKKINSAVNKGHNTTIDKLSESMAVPAHEAKEEVISEFKPKMADLLPKVGAVYYEGCLNDQEKRTKFLNYLDLQRINSFQWCNPTQIRTEIEGRCCCDTRHVL